MYGFDGRHDLALTDKDAYFNPSSTALYMLVRETMRMISPTSKDFANFVRLTDFLDHLHAQSTAMTVDDVPDTLVDRFRFYLIIKNSVKPIIACAFTIEGLYDMKHMLEIVLGGEEALRKRPCLLINENGVK